MKALVPALIVAAALIGSYVVRPAETAIDIRITGATSLTVKVVKPGRSRIEARGDTGSDGRVRLAVEPGRYRVGADVPRGTRIRSIPVVVGEDEVVRVTLRVER